MNDTERIIYELVKDRYGEYAIVEIFVNCEGISVKTFYPENLKARGVSMRNIKGEFVNEEEN